MPEVVRTTFETPPGFQSTYVARIYWQMEAQRTLLLESVKGLSPAELEWQPAPGMNTIGMLLAHIAHAENHMVVIGVEGLQDSDTKEAIGISADDEGMPLAKNAPPSPALAGKDLAFYMRALELARTHTRRVMEGLTDADLARLIVRKYADDRRREFDVGWMLYHLLEHEAGHRGQIQVLRHLMAVTRA